MRKTIALFLLAACFFRFNISLNAQPGAAPGDKKFQTQTEVVLPVRDFGKVYNVPFATDRPDPNLQYKIVFEASMQKLDSSILYEPLEIAARLYNLHVYGGVPQKNLDVVLVIGGEGIPVVLSNEAYKKRYGRDNPNQKILDQLRGAGVKVNGCAQAMLKHHIDPADVAPDIAKIFSRLTTVATYQLKGYAYFRF
jgi:intracellular sulfur oxidation DsrE/DsrF family protein